MRPRWVILIGSACLALFTAGCGGGDDEADAASATEATRCIEEQGLGVESQSSEIDEQIGAEESLLISLPDAGGQPNAIKVSFFESEDAASEQADSESSFIEGTEAGGSVEQDGTVVITIARSGNEEQLEQVKGCL